MTLDTRTDAEKRYDAERDGSLYVTRSPAWEAILDITAKSDDDGKPREDTPLSDSEETILSLLIA